MLKLLSIHPDVRGKVWLGTSHGLKNASFSNNLVQLNAPPIKMGDTSFQTAITCMLRENNGELWLGTLHWTHQN